jgi:hypothetical protein
VVFTALGPARRQISENLPPAKKKIAVKHDSGENVVSISVDSGFLGSCG